MSSTGSRAGSVEAIFDALIGLPASVRRHRCARLCGDDATLREEVLSLLDAASRAGRFLSVPPSLVAASPSAPPLDAASLLGRRLGAYRIVRELGSGGMGVVFLAERSDGHYRQQVAIKLLGREPSSDAAVRRFHLERQVLADLQHPNIARLLDGGTSAEGYPYLVMEHVPGEPIDAYCRRGDLSPTRTLELVRTACEAVQHAHRNLIVHCDLKPANILVTATGVPKLLDFGIARLLRPTPPSADASDTACETLPLTPDFAAPEQLAGGTITTASDVYALGVVLYRLLAGEPPYTLRGNTPSTLAEELAARAVRPPSEVAPRALRRCLRGDLDRIVMKALSKEPRRRYPSAESLAEDIGRFLAGRPVDARDPTCGYLARKFLARHRWRASLGAAALASLVAGSVVSTWQWRLARERQVHAEQRFEEVRELTATMVFELPAVIARAPGSTRLRERLFSRGATYLDRLARARHGSPELLRELAATFHELARLQGNPGVTNLGDPGSALDNFEKALALREELLVARPHDPELRVELASSYAEIGLLHGGAFGELKRADELTGRCLRLLTPLQPSPDIGALAQLLICHTLAAHWHNVDGHHRRAARHLRAAERAYTTLAPDHPFLSSFTAGRLRARILEERAEVAAGNGDHALALRHERQRLAIVRTRLQDETPAWARLDAAASHAYAARLLAAGHLTEARDAYARAIDAWERLQRSYPDDASATQALVLVHAELAGAQERVAAAALDGEAAARTLVAACAAYGRSVSTLRRLPDARAEFPRRYTWSPSTASILERHDALCQEGNVDGVIGHGAGTHPLRSAPDRRHPRAVTASPESRRARPIARERVRAAVSGDGLQISHHVSARRHLP